MIERKTSRIRKSMTERELSDFLLRLHSDRDRAGEEYERIRQRIIDFFRFHHCLDAEKLADETIDRAIRRLQETDVGDVRTYLFGVASYVLRETFKRPEYEVPLDPERVPVFVDPNRAWEQKSEDHLYERRLTCLRQCLQMLQAREQRLILDYDLEEGSIEKRRKLAESLGITPSNLRVQMFRVRRKLRGLVEECLRHSKDS